MERQTKPAGATQGIPTPLSGDGDIIAQLTELAGVETGYLAADGSAKTIGRATISKVLASLGFAADPTDQAERSLGALERRDARLPPVLVVEQGNPIEITVPANAVGEATCLRWRLKLEDGKVLEDESPVRSVASRAPVTDRSQLRLLLEPCDIPTGYHSFSLADWDQETCRLIVVPERAYQPPRWNTGHRDWLVTVQLYSLRSRDNWGVGDFGDVRRLSTKAAASGAAGIGLNPLHALFPGDPARVSPYSPSSRSFLNPIYLDISAIPEFARSDRARRRVDSGNFQVALAEVRRRDLVDYQSVWTLKSAVLGDLHAQFRQEAFSSDGRPLTQRARDFVAFQERGGARLREFARHQASQEVRPDETDGLDGHGLDRAHAEQTSFFEYLQFETERQLREVQAFARAAGMSIGLYLDIAVGIDPAGADRWIDRSLYVDGFSIGAPPDIANPLGQDWGLGPPNPFALRDQGYAPFIEMVRAGMAYAGAIRVDHILGLRRLWWVPHGKTAAEGAYVNYPLDDLLGILALESHRHQCIVIGEDLGTVPPGFRDTLARRAILSYRLLQFERDPESGEFLAAERYPELAVAGFSTHDLPTIQGLVSATDLAWRRALELYPSEEVAAIAVRSRTAMLERLRDALGLSTSAMADPETLAAAVHAYLAATPARLVLVQIEDLLGLREQMNLPGTVGQHPNWRRRLDVAIDDVLEGPLAKAVIERMSIR